MPYFGLYVPGIGHVHLNGFSENAADRSPQDDYVFDEKKTALEALKLYKDARLREFDIREDAIKYAQTGYEVIRNKHPEDKSPVPVSEATSQFRMPPRSELVKFKKLIEEGKYDAVRQKIWENPRYLVNNGDTPTTLREGCRYNALHICALSRQAKVAELILQTVSNVKFVELLVGKKDDKICEELARNLLDYYLNITEKGRNDTPLHLASKVCCLEMVKLLVSYPLCRMKPNSENLYPHEVVGTRSKICSTKDIPLIYNLCYQPYYVPVLCSVDNTVPPQVGAPFTWNNPPDFKGDAFSPELKIQALAGPMQPDAAEKFCRRWKTPPRIGSDASGSPFSSFMSPSPDKLPTTPNNNTAGNSPRDGILTLHRRVLFKNQSAQDDDIEDEMEKININDAVDCGLGSNHNSNSNVAIENNNNNGHNKSDEEILEHNHEAESTPQKHEISSSGSLCPSTLLLQRKRNLFYTYREPTIPDSPAPECVDFTPPKVLNSRSMSNQMQENPLTEDVDIDTPGFKERHMKITDIDKGLECIGRELAAQTNTEWSEYWDFLDAFIDIRTVEGLALLNQYFMAKENLFLENGQNNSSLLFNEKKLCAMDTYHVNSMNDVNGDVVIQDKYKPYLCIEKSLQVYAKRITKILQNNYAQHKELSEALMYELKRLKSVIVSFKADVRFQQVDFTKVHARIARLVVYYASTSLALTPEKQDKLTCCLKESTRDSDQRLDYYICFCQHVLDSLTKKSALNMEYISNTEVVCQEQWMLEVSCDCDLHTNLMRITSRRLRSKCQPHVPFLKHDDNNANLTNEEEQQQAEAAEDADDSEFLDCEDSDDTSDSDDGEIFLTPKQHRSFEELSDIKTSTDKNQMFIFGNTPTKRDLDVLNAIFDVTPEKLASVEYVAKWRDVMLSFSEAEMAEFPSPKKAKKTQTVSCLSNATLSKEFNSLTIMPQKSTLTDANMSDSKENIIQPLTVKKRLLLSPKLTRKPTLASSSPISSLSPTSSTFPFTKRTSSPVCLNSPSRNSSASAVLASIIQAKKKETDSMTNVPEWSLTDLHLSELE